MTIGAYHILRLSKEDYIYLMMAPMKWCKGTFGGAKA